MKERVKQCAGYALCFVAGVVICSKCRDWLEWNVPFSYRQTIPDTISYILIGDLA